MRVLFLTQYGMLGASSRTRAYQYFPLLEERGIQCQAITVLPDHRIQGSQILVNRNRWRKLFYYLWASWRTLRTGLQFWGRADRFDLLYVQKVILPAPLRWLLRRRGKPVLFDFDDAIFTTEVQHGNWLNRWKQRRNAAGLPAMLRLASGAIVENEYTGEYAGRYTPVTIITGPIDTDGHYPATRSRQRQEVVLGWIGSATTLPYLESLAGPLRRLGRRYPHMCLEVVGAESVALDGVSVRTRPWQLEDEVEALHNFDIGLMPIPDDPWTRGKGGYKLLQYMAVGLPVVTSPVGINCRIVEHGVNGFWARDEQEWEQGLARLIVDADLRRRMGQAGRRLMETRYSLRSSARILAQTMERTVQGVP